MKCAILGMIACLTPLVALAECDDVSDDHLNEYDHHHHEHEDEPKSDVERWTRAYQLQEIAEQAQRDYFYQQDEEKRQKAIIKELREIKNNQLRMMGETVPPSFSFDD